MKTLLPASPPPPSLDDGTAEDRDPTSPLQSSAHLWTGSTYGLLPPKNQENKRKRSHKLKFRIIKACPEAISKNETSNSGLLQYLAVFFLKKRKIKRKYPFPPYLFLNCHLPSFLGTSMSIRIIIHIPNLLVWPRLISPLPPTRVAPSLLSFPVVNHFSPGAEREGKRIECVYSHVTNFREFLDEVVAQSLDGISGINES